MVSSNPIDEFSNTFCKYDIKCSKLCTNQCQLCGQIYCIDHYLEHKNEFEKHFQYVIDKHQLLTQKLKLLISKLSTDDILDLIKEIYQFKIKLDKIEKTINKLNNFNNQFDSNNKYYFENDIQHLIKDIKQLQFKFQQINKISKEQLNIQSDHLLGTIKSSSLNKNKYYQFKQKSNDLSVLSHLLFRQISTSIIDNNQNELDLTKIENEIDLQTEQEKDNIEIIPSDTGPKITRKIRLSNNIVKYLRGPLKIMVDGTMHIVEICAHQQNATYTIKQAINKGLQKQNNITIKQENNDNAFIQITSDWNFIEPNSDRGFNSESLWMKDPQGRRILIKIQDHPLCAANEWLAFVLGKFIGLPVNRVQISIYQNKLVTLHTDVKQQDENIFTFMDLPKQIRNKLLTDPIMQSMDLFDHFIQNVDRNPRNILITISNQTNIYDQNAKFKIFLIDHSSCFGMGKLNGISVFASKLHSQHLAVVKFHPIDQANKFYQYLNKIPTEDTILINKTLFRFAQINDQQIDYWMTQIQDLLSTSQYNRIHTLLYRQRDIIRQYIIKYQIYPNNSIIKLDQDDQYITYF